MISPEDLVIEVKVEIVGGLPSIDIVELNSPRWQVSAPNEVSSPALLLNGQMWLVDQAVLDLYIEKAWDAVDQHFGSTYIYLFSIVFTNENPLCLNPPLIRRK